MSLVNNMLKDLDQRRKSSDSTGAAAELVPAAEVPRSGKSRFLIFFTLLLVGVGGGYAYLMYEEIELWDMEVSESLNIIPERVAMPAERPVVEESSRAVASSDANGQSGSNQQLTDSQSATDSLDSSSSANSPEPAVTTPTSNETVTPGFTSPAATAGNAGLQQSPLESLSSDVADLDLATDPTVLMPGQFAGEESIESLADGGTPALVDGDLQAEIEQTVALLNVPPAESIKDYAEMTPEEQDTLAVQYALRLIASNETIAAYTSLEQHIMQNRYAHQSRETYGKLLVNDGEYLAARNVIESGLGLAPNHAGFKKIKARILITNGALEEAVVLLSSRAPSINEDIEYHEILATAQLASRDYSGALNSYTQLVRQDRRQGRWWYGFAASQESLGNREAARQGYDQALQQSNLSPNLRRRIQERLTVLNE